MDVLTDSMAMVFVLDGPLTLSPCLNPPQINGAKEEDVIINVVFNQIHRLPETYIHEMQDDEMGISTERQVLVGIV